MFCMEGTRQHHGVYLQAGPEGSFKGEEQLMSGFDDVWQRIVTLRGETFRQKRGKPFTYMVSGDSLTPSTTNRQVPRSHFAEAFARLPVDGPGQLQDLQGPSFLFAILTDPRVRAS
jgi:hypothetical protein